MQVENNYAHVTTQREFEQIHWNQVFCEVYGLAVMLSISKLTASKSIDEIYLVDKKSRIIILTLNSPSERFSPHFMIQRWCRERGHCIWQSFLHCMSPLKNIWANFLNLYVPDAKNPKVLSFLIILIKFEYKFQPHLTSLVLP